MKEKPCLVTTEHRSVFFGYLVTEPSAEQVTLRRARICLYWDRSLKGFIGLATDGPNDKCRVGPPAEETILFGITSISVVSPEAVERWEGAPWG
jgi:hypothetical protein